MNEDFYRKADLKLKEVENASVGMREFGEGDPIFLIHGFPTHGYTWRKIIPELSNKYKCHVVDLPGLGESKWNDRTDFSSSAQAARLIALMESMYIQKCSLIAHNSGATIARVIAVERPDLIDKLILINTEIPGHRPPWIPFYQKVSLWPFMPDLIRKALKWNWFIKSSMGFKEAYSDKTFHNKPENLGPYIRSVTQSPQRTTGAFKYLKGIDWQIVDGFKDTHQLIKANTLLVWGEDDKTFPLEKAKEMLPQFTGKCELKVIKGASLLPHEEKSEEVNTIILNFLDNNTTS